MNNFIVLVIVTFCCINLQIVQSVCKTVLRLCVEFLRLFLHL